MHLQHTSLSLRPIATAVFLATALLGGCGGSSSDSSNSSSATPSAPAAPVAQGVVDSAAVPSATAFVDTASTAAANSPCYVDANTNAGIRLLKTFLDLWTPVVNQVTNTVQMDSTAITANTTCTTGVTANATWDGTPTTGGAATTTGSAVLAANITYVETATQTRTAAQADAAYYDDRRNKSYSVTDGLGPLTDAWRTGSGIATTITSIPADASTVLYNEAGTDYGVTTGGGNTAFGEVVDFVMNAVANPSDGSGTANQGKYYYKYARPYRWSGNVVVVPTLVPAKSLTPKKDAGFASGHTAEGYRAAIGMAYAVPERFQELLTRASELGENRILSGMHSPLDVMGGRMNGTAAAAAHLYNSNYYNPSGSNNLKTSGYNQAHTYLQANGGAACATSLNDCAHSATTATDRFADHDANKANYARRMTYGFSKIGTAGQTAVVPKGAEVLLETRLPYLTAEQRRVVLKTTAFDSGYPLLDDAEGWGRLNLFAAADGYGVFTGDVTVTMDAALLGFNAIDTWRNDISGSGLFTKLGTGTLILAGANAWSGGTIVAGGILSGMSAKAFGNGDVYVRAGTLQSDVASGAVAIGGNLTVLDAGTLDVVVGSGSAGSLAVTKQATLGGTLHVGFRSGYTPKAGDTITLLTASTRQGNFKSIAVDGFSNTKATYTATGVQLVLN